MSSDKITYSFCIENLRYIYKIIGYDALINEINFIHHLTNPIPKTTNSSQTFEETPSKVVEVQPNIIQTQIPDSESTKDEYINNESTKNIIISEPNTKYTRTELPDNLRCEGLKKDGTRCTLKKDNNTTIYCSRHLTKYSN